LPVWLVLGGVGVVVVVLYMRHKSSATTSTNTSQPLVPAVTTDPNTGLPVDPLTGLSYAVSQPTGPIDINAWITQAENALVAHGYSPALASQALYDYANENQLSTAEAGAINQAFKLVGFAPGPPLPFLGTPPAPPSPTPIKPPRFLTPVDWRHLSPIKRLDWRAVVTSGGAHGYLPQGSALPSGAHWASTITQKRTATSKAS
jgi:hypothetical protein